MSSAVPRAVTPARGFLFVVLAAVCWGTSGLTASVVTRRTGLDPLDIAWHRMAVGAVVLAVAHVIGRRRAGGGGDIRPTRSTAVRLVLVGVGLATYQTTYFLAVEQAGVSIATLVALGAAPVLIALGGIAVGSGRPDGATVAALVVALAGLLLLVGVSAADDPGGTVLLGAVFALACAAAYAVVVLTSSGMPAGVPTTTIGFVVGAVAITPVALAAGLDLTTDPLSVLLLAYLGLVPTALAYGLFFAGVRVVPAAVASIVTLLEPLTATVLATALLGEELAPTALAGGLLMLAAVAAMYLRRMGDSNSRGLAPNPLSKRAP